METGNLMNYLLGIDLGTSSLKTIVLSRDGQILSADALDYQFDSPVQGYAEQDPAVWWDACVNTIKISNRNHSFKTKIPLKNPIQNYHI